MSTSLMLQKEEGQSKSNRREVSRYDVPLTYRGVVPLYLRGKEQRMTDNERALHKILSECVKPYHPEGDTDTTKEEQMQNRLEEIEHITGMRVVANAEANART